MSFDTVLYMRDTQGSLVAVRGNVDGSFRTSPSAESMAAYSVRGAVATAIATLTKGTPGVLLSGTTSEFHDLIEVSMSNNSTATVQVSLVDDGTIIRNFQLPGSSTIQQIFSPPFPANASGSTWYADMEDITNSQVTVNALFVRNT